MAFKYPPVASLQQAPVQLTSNPAQRWRVWIGNAPDSYVNVSADGYMDAMRKAALEFKGEHRNEVVEMIAKIDGGRAIEQLVTIHHNGRVTFHGSPPRSGYDGNPSENPHEVHSEKGHEDTFANIDDAEHFADELRRSGVREVEVRKRTRRAGRQNPAHSMEFVDRNGKRVRLGDKVTVYLTRETWTGTVSDIPPAATGMGWQAGGMVTVERDDGAGSRSVSPASIEGMAKNPEEQLDTEILGGIERALWVTSWAEYVQSLSKEDRKREGLPVNLSGLDFDDVAPDAPTSALLAAQDLYLLIERANGKTPGELFQEACRVDGCDWNDENAELFGHYLAMQSIGEGVSWFDDHKQFRLKFPDRGFEAHYDDGEVWWSPQVQSRQNPAGASSIKIGDIVARQEAPTQHYRVTSTIRGARDIFRILPHRFSGAELVLMRIGSTWTAGGSRMILVARSPKET